uniref:BCAS3 domain-containing protein n=1 Tax=Anopheles dirus TaxID=7168 RepID=A0A182NGI0_9DIPT
MSADSQRSRPMAASIEGSSSVLRCMPSIVPPQAVSDRSIIDSVAGFINDVTLQTQAPLGDTKDHILWVRFESAADISDPCLGNDWELEGGIAPPLLLILGYVTGVQVWIVPANGEAIEVLSWRHSSVKCLRVLPTPIFGDRELATEPTDQFTHKRPLIALCDSSSSGSSAGAVLTSSNGGYQYCSVNFISLKNGETVKSIKFKSPIVDILANRSSVVVTFPERIAVFDARTLEDRLTVTTCHPSPGLNPNPVVLGSRWIAYAERRLLPSKRSSGGCEGDGVTSYTATVLNAAKSLGKGLRELGEQVAAGLTGSHLGSSLGSSLIGGGSAGIGGVVGFGSNTGSSGDLSGALAAGGLGSTGSLNEGNQPGVVTVLDIKYPVKDVSPTTGTPITCTGSDPIVAHFLAHTEAIVALAFDAPGMLLLTADKRGHDFHVFRLHPHPSGASLAAVHHLYVLHRGDTTAKVQDVAFSLDSRWVAVSTLRGTTHVFPVTPYGGPAGVRTHGSPHVVNRLSRFHRSAGLSIDGRSSSPISHSSDGATSGAHHISTATAYANPRTPPFPNPTIVQPLAQLRQPVSLLGTSSGGNNIGTCASGALGTGKPSSGGHHGHHTRQRNSSSSSSDDLVKPLRVCASFAKARSWLLDPPGCSVRDTPAHRIQRTPKEKICDDTPIELEVEAKAQWCLQRQENSAVNDIQPPLSLDNWLIKDRFLEEGVSSGGSETGTMLDYDRLQHTQHRGSTGSISGDHDDRWLSQVEIITHAGPHRRLWMGPQFMFKTYNTPSGSPLSSIDTEAVEICTGSGSSAVLNRPLQRSNPVNMPSVGGSYEQSPRLMNMNEFRHHENLDTEFSSLGPVESQLREDLADAMRESPLIATGRDTTETSCGGGVGDGIGQQQQYQQHHQQLATSALNQQPLASTTGLSSVSSCSSTSIYSSTHSLSSICEHQHQQLQQPYYHTQYQRHKNGGVCGSGGSECRISSSGDGGGYGWCTSGGDCSSKACNIVRKNAGTAQSSVHYNKQHCHSDVVRSESVASGRNIYLGSGITIAKVVNPLGTVTTISTVGGNTIGQDTIESDDFMQECGEAYLHENCDEALFRPVVTVHHDTAVVTRISPNEVDMSEMRSSRYRGSSLDRIGCGNGGDAGISGARKFMITGYGERPLSQPASLIGRDLIVPVIEEKNLSYFMNNSGAYKTQSPTFFSSEVRQRLESTGPTNVLIVSEAEQQRTDAREALTRHGQQEHSIDESKKLPKAITIDIKDLKCESHSTTKGKSATEAKLRVYEGFENIELAAVNNVFLKNSSAIDHEIALKEGKHNTTKTEVSMEYQITTSRNVETKRHKEKTPFDAATTSVCLSPSVNRKAKKNSGKSWDLIQNKKSDVEHTISENCGIKRTSINHRGGSKDSRKEKDTLSQVNPKLHESQANEQLLPPLEALKIDDFELFGEDMDRESSMNPAVSSSRKGNVIVMKQPSTTKKLHNKHDLHNSNNRDETIVGDHQYDHQDESVVSGPTELNTSYAQLAAKDNSLTMLESVELQSHAILELSNFATDRDSDNCTDAQLQDAKQIEKTLISFESPLLENAIVDRNINKKTMCLDHQGQIAAEMQDVLVGGNILLAMCSSLRVASPPLGLESTVTLEKLGDSIEGEESGSSSVSINFVVEQPSLEGQDSDYKSLELDMEMASTGIVEVTNMSASTAATEAATIVSLFFSTSEDDEEATENSTKKIQEYAGSCNTVFPGVLEDDGNKQDESTNKRWQCRRSANNHHNTSEIFKLAAGEANDDEVDEREENGDEDDEELQPLISSNKTSSSSLSTTIATKKEPAMSEEPVSLDVARNEVFSLHASLPAGGVEVYAKDKELAQTTIGMTIVASMGGMANERSAESDLTAAKETCGTKVEDCLTTNNSGSSIGLSASMTSFSVTNKIAESAAA